MASSKEMMKRAAAKKAQAKKPVKRTVEKILSIGAFYKVDQDVGFGLSINKDLMDVDILSKHITEGADSYNAQIGVGADWLTSAALAADLIQQMDEWLVPTICQELYGQPSQPTAGIRKDVNLQPSLKLILVFMMNVKWLSDNGYLVSDDSNGMLYLTQVD